ncbi:hypothetical protein E2542_SST15254 [Spatholobus suberectus]|nr:hypothetical protein E2542_SST15254 [Spatholobus suberectus]
MGDMIMPQVPFKSVYIFRFLAESVNFEASRIQTPKIHFLSASHLNSTSFDFPLIPRKGFRGRFESELRINKNTTSFASLLTPIADHVAVESKVKIVVSVSAFYVL